MGKLNYPKARRDETAVDVYHGVEIKDPYRWLENSDSDETKAFVDAQNAISKPFIRGCSKRQAIHDRLTQIWNHPTYSCPMKHGDKYYVVMNTGLQNHSILFVQDSLEGEPKIFLDPNALSDDGTIALDNFKFSEDGSIMAYLLFANGSDWGTIHFINTKTGKKYPEILDSVMLLALAWTHDSQGVFYSCYTIETTKKSDDSSTVGMKKPKLFYHRIGTPQSEDVLVVDFPENPLSVYPVVTDCGKWLIVTVRHDAQKHVAYFAKLDHDKEIKEKIELTEIFTDSEATYEYVANAGGKAIFITDKNASNSRLIGIDLENFKIDNWSEYLAEHPRNVLKWATAVDGDKLLVCYMEDIKDVLKVYDLVTGMFLKQIPTDPGTVTHIFADKKSSQIFYGFTSFLIPESIYTVDLKTDQPPKVFRESKVEGFDASLYKTNQIFYTSKDDTKIPMFIVSNKDVVLDSSSPCLLYGGFSESEQPTFNAFYITFMHHLNGVLAVAHVRGGGEYGEKWHEAGTMHKKQNVFDDFQYATKYLIENRYTSPKKLIINGRSNGGLLVAACVNQRPDLFGAAIAEVGVMDMLKFHKFEPGKAWISDYGSSDDPEQFKTLLKYSPLHNVKPPKDGGQYPAILLLTADHDERVVPLHSLKLIATLQREIGRLPQQTNPLLAMVEVNVGHDENKPTSKAIEEKTEILSFIVQALNLEFK